MSDGILFIVCGPSGVGKTSLCDTLLKARPRLRLSVSYTTRKPRVGEVHGEAYYFVDVPTFETMRETNQFAECAEVHGNYYGTAIRVIQDSWKNGHDVLFDIDYQGAQQLKACFPHACSVLIIPPNIEILEKRLRGRATDEAAVIERRLAAAKHELSQFELFDYIVENADLVEASKALIAIYDAQAFRTHLHSARIQAMLEDGPVN